MSGLVHTDRVGVTLDGALLLAPTSTDVGAGRALAVTGANGAGKTTLLRVLAGLTRPTTGSATVAGAAPDERDPAFRSLVAALIGIPPLARDLTLREHMTLVGASWGATVPEAQERSDGLLEDVGLARFATRFPHELSSGQTQLFSLALTLTRPFDVLLLDEPEQRLDVDRLRLLGGLLREVVDEGATLVMACHSAVLVDLVADDRLHLDGAPPEDHPEPPPRGPDRGAGPA